MARLPPSHGGHRGSTPLDLATYEHLTNALKSIYSEQAVKAALNTPSPLFKAMQEPQGNIAGTLLRELAKKEKLRKAFKQILELRGKNTGKQAKAIARKALNEKQTWD